MKYDKYTITEKINSLWKDKYCQEKGIYLIRIPYYESKNIEKILREELFD